MRRQHGGIASLLAGLLLGLTAVPGAAATPDPFMGDPFDQGQALTYRWAAGFAPPTSIKTAINAAAEDANESRASRAPTFAYDSDAPNAVAYGTDVCGVNGLACFRRDAPTWFALHLRENGHRYDWGTLRWCEASGRPDGCYDAENITLDELGHVLGLDHHENLPDDSDYGDAVVQTYSRTKPRAFYNAHAFGRCDVATLQQVYDVLHSGTPYSTCLDVPSTLALAASRTSVTAGSVVTFTATLKSAGTGRLAGNLVSTRTVVLQQRTATSWTDVLVMTAGPSGTYTAGLAMRATSDVRAVFRKPSTEGLRASSSAAIPITVTPACSAGLCPQGTPGTGS